MWFKSLSAKVLKKFILKRIQLVFGMIPNDSETDLRMSRNRSD